MAPFDQDGSFADLAMEELEVFSGEDQIWAEYQNHGDALAFGARWAAFSRASVGPTLAASLDPAGDRTIEFCSRLEARMTPRLAAAPERMLIPLAKMVLVRE